MTGELPNQNNWKPESSIKSTARDPSLTVQTGVLPQITPSVCLDISLDEERVTLALHNALCLYWQPETGTPVRGHERAPGYQAGTELLYPVHIY